MKRRKRGGEGRGGGGGDGGLAWWLQVEREVGNGKRGRRKFDLSI